MSVSPTTVVVPVYGDLSTLVPCVQSLLENVDQSVHRVLLVNDCGPQADEIERALLDLIDGNPGFSYARNDRNLGFVGTCNRAALELDTTDNDILLLNSDTITTPGFLEELSAVLHESDQHGAVCPRSNNATIASLPFQLRVKGGERPVARTAQVHAELRDLLPRYSVSPVAMGFCILIRRELIREFGLFDETFAPGYGEENDFCLRVRQHGFASLIAHRALVFHIGGRSFVGPKREALRTAHEKIVVTRYPFYTDAVQSYIHVERDPVDVFADALVPDDTVVRVLIDFDSFAEDGPSHSDRALLVAANAASAREGTAFTAAVPDAHARTLARAFRSLTVVPHSRLDGLWDVALPVSAAPSATQLARLNRTSLRWVAAEELADPAERWMLRTKATRAEPADLIEELISRFGRRAVDLAGLRERWRSITSFPDYVSGATIPGERRRVRLLHRAELIAPRPVGWAKAVAKKALGRSS